jgi:hypothetical protein
LESAKAEHPVAHAVGQAAGYLIPGGAIDRGVNTVLKGSVEVLPKIAQRAIIGGTSGAAQEFLEGSIRGDKPIDIAKRTAIGGAIGAGGDLALSGLDAAFNKLRGAVRTPAEQIAQNTEKVAIEPIKSVKPISQQGKFTIKNSAYDSAVNDYNSAIEKIQNHFGTNELRANEVPLIKSELGIDLDSIISRMEQAEKPIKLDNSSTMQLKRVSGAANNNSYDLAARLKNQSNLERFHQPLNDNLGVNSVDNINSKPILKTQPVMVNKSIAGNVGLKECSFPQNVIGSRDIPEELANKLNAKKMTYEPISEKATLEKAVKTVEANPEKAYTDVLTQTGKGISRDDVATGELLIKKAFETGDNEKAYTLISHLAEKLTEAGQTIQAAAMFKRMTPEGMLMYAEKSVNKANRELLAPVKKGGFIDPLKKFYKQGSLTDEMKSKIKSAMDEAQLLPEGREKAVKMAEVMQTISEAMPKSPLGKTESFRTIAMLSNPKTWIRNFVSNAAFGAVESGFTKPISVLTDKVLKLRTGQRSLLNTNFKELGSGFVEGTKNAISDVRRGIDTSPTRGALELPRANEFKNIPIIREIEKAVKLGVSGGDRPFYEAAYKDALAEQMKLFEKNTGKKALGATEEMKAAADEVAKYRTYADNNMLSDSLSKVKSGLNKFRVGGIGAGDVLMKFTKTPANLVARGIDYSPAGLVKGMVDIVRVFAGNSSIQRKAAEGFARGTIGTGFVSAAIVLTNLGVFRGEKAKSNTANAFEQATGKGQYTINFSALQRLITSGMNPEAAKEQQGDTISTYDWAQPLALSTAVGANIGEDIKRKQKINTLDLIGVIAESMSSGANTIIEQPMLQNINRVFKGDNPVQGLLSVVQDYPASFVPAFLSGMRYAADENLRDTSGSFLESTGKRIVNKLPVLSKKLDKTVDILGNDRTVTGKTPLSRAADSAFNPTKITKVNYTNATNEINRLYKLTNEGDILPNLVEKTDTIPPIKKGDPVKELTPEQRTQYQKILANTYLNNVDQLISNKNWKLFTDEAKVKSLSNIRNRSDDIAKKQMQSIIYGTYTR